MQTMIGVAEARQLVLEAMPSMGEERVALETSLGRTLGAPVISRDTIPPFDNSGMDGFAVRTADLRTVPKTLVIGETIAAGQVPHQQVGQGIAARIMTGAPVPTGADAVVPIEWTSRDGGRVVISRAPAGGQHIRRAGKDVRRGETVFEAGRIITPPVIGMLATLGYAEVQVRKVPQVAVIATGDELVPPHADLGPGQIRNANGPALMAQVTTAGGTASAFHAHDDRDDIRRVIRAGLASDVLVFSGGVSVGDYDYVKQVLDEMGLELHFWKVRQRPGKPLAFGMLAGKPVFGLPGNPVSSAMCFEQYVRPALAQMLGRQVVVRPPQQAVLVEQTPKVAGLHFFTRGYAAFGEAGRLEVRDTGPQASNLYSSVVRANCIVHLPEEMVDPEPGTAVGVEWLPWHPD